MFAKVLVANRGEIACRILRSLRRLGVRSVAVYSDADRHAPHVRDADEAVRLGPGPASQSYLRADLIIDAARATGAQAIHPGYGFLSENADFAAACADAGVVFVGPTPQQMRDFGLKHRARELAAANDVALLPGTGLLADAEEARREALRIGYPVMLKSTAGGGGIGMQCVRDAAELGGAFEAVERLASKNFSRGGAYLEKYIERARHLEVQIFGDGAGAVIALGERDCSTQRRNQKIIEETPAPNLDPSVRAGLHAAAVRLARAVGYRSAGTVEFVYDVDTARYYFLEVNTRLQVEHCVTEEVTGVDLVEWMLRLAAGERWPLAAPPARGAAIEVRVYAEDPARGFRPSTGTITQALLPPVRVEAWVEDGTEVTPLYDPLLAKIVAAGADRPAALERLSAALDATRLDGIETNLDYLRGLLRSPPFVAGAMTTRTVEGFAYRRRALEVLAGGAQTTVQDHPGRVGFWAVGVPPSGPMDAWSFRLANRALGNPPDAAALEMTMSGPVLKFDAPLRICLAGAPMAALLDGREIPFWTPVDVPAGATLAVGGAATGCRAYLAVAGGFDVPSYLSSRATFTLGGFGGHGGRALRAGDVLHVGVGAETGGATVPEALRPRIGDRWEIGVLYGPHGAPDFFTDEDIETFFAAEWTVHHHSNRTGVRLIGPKPVWARRDGGEAGLHPSNIHDNAYAIGAVDFTGDMPVILGPDGPSLGGFVCPAVVATAELWKLGQLRPNDRVRFTPMTAAAADAARIAGEQTLQSFAPPPPAPSLSPSPSSSLRAAARESAILAQRPAQGARPAAVYRRAGDAYLLVEYGPPVLDLELRLRVHALMGWLEHRALRGVIDVTPGIRSLQVHFDPDILPTTRLLDELLGAEEGIGAIEDMSVATRIVNLPLSWDDVATRIAIDKYVQSVRADAPWCPSNIEFIRRINGLASVEEVKRIVFEASYLVLGLGDVYLGAPVAVPVDPRHRLVTTKYNPARTWTPENAVGIGGAYLCVYGMEGPGGYQFVGRTCQVWNTFRRTPDFPAGKPWLLRFFDQIRFYPVSGEELLEFRDGFLHGRQTLQVSESLFRLSEHRAFLAAHAADIDAHQRRRQAAFEEERRRWEASGALRTEVESETPRASGAAPAAATPPGHLAVASPVSGSVWKIVAVRGQRVRAGETLLVLESMKMELAVAAPVDAEVTHLHCAEGRAVTVAETLLTLRPAAAPS